MADIYSTAVIDTAFPVVGRKVDPIMHVNARQWLALLYFKTHAAQGAIDKGALLYSLDANNHEGRVVS